MQTWGYSIIQSQGGLAQTSAGPMQVGQMLNLVGQKGGELVAVVPTGNNVFEWIFKFPMQAPQSI